jgi:hypothetical protein
VPVTQLSTLGLYGYPGAEYAGGFSLLPGREYSLEYLALADVGDPAGGNSFGHAANVIANGNRAADGGLQFYRPPGRGGVSAGASYTRDDTNRDPSNRAWGMSLGYGLGPVTLRAAYQNRHVAKVNLYDLAGNNMEARNALIAANMRFSWGTAYVGYSANRGWGSSPLFNPDNPYGAGMATTPSLDDPAGLVHPQERPRPGQPRRERICARRVIYGHAAHRFLRRLLVHPEPERGRHAAHRLRCARPLHLGPELRHAPRVLIPALRRVN